MWKILAMIVVLLVAGCNGGDKPDHPITDKDYKKGTDGLVFDFHDNAPPTQVFEEEKFEIALDVWNKGAYEVTDGYATVIVENAYITILSNGQPVVATGTKFNPAITKNFMELEPAGTYTGRSVSTPEGTSKFVNFNAQARKMDLLTVQHTSPVILTTCYGYVTELAQDVCIDPDPRTEIDKVCDTGDITLADQGAPIAITKIETKILPADDKAKPQFLIYIKNMGDGEVVERNKLKDACSAGELTHVDWNRVYLTEFGFSNREYYYTYDTADTDTIECKPNPLKLTGEGDFIRCTLKEGLQKSAPSYKTQAYLKFDYGYTKSVTKNVVIEKIE